MRFLHSVTAFLMFSLPVRLFAQQPPPVQCPGLFGCPGTGPQTPTPQNVILTSALPTAIELLGTFAGGAAVILIAVAGVQMVLSGGDESKISSARWSVLYALIGLSIAIMSQTIVAAVATETYGAGPGNLLINLMRDVIRFILIAFNVGFVLAVMIAGIRMTVNGGKSDEFTKSIFVIKWAIGGAIVTNSAAALVRALSSFTF